jgi:hypothetical protein
VGTNSVLVIPSEVAVAVARLACVLRRLVLHANLLTLVLLSNAIFEAAANKCACAYAIVHNSVGAGCSRWLYVEVYAMLVSVHDHEPCVFLYKTIQTAYASTASYSPLTTT